MKVYCEKCQHFKEECFDIFSQIKNQNNDCSDYKERLWITIKKFFTPRKGGITPDQIFIG